MIQGYTLTTFPNTVQCNMHNQRNRQKNLAICTGYTGSIITHKSAEQPDGGKRTTETAQNKETFQRAGS